MLDDLALPKAPNYFGEVLGKLALVGRIDLTVAKEVLQKVEDRTCRTAIFDAAMGSINASPSGQGLIAMQATEIQACEGLHPQCWKVLTIMTNCLSGLRGWSSNFVFSTCSSFSEV